MNNARLTLKLEILMPHTAKLIRSTSASVEKETLSELLPEIEASFKKWLTLQMQLLSRSNTNSEKDLPTDKAEE